MAWGQPALLSGLCPFSASIGIFLFFCSVSHVQLRTRRALLGFVWFAGVQAVQLSWLTSIEFQGYYILGVYVGLLCFLGGQFSFWICCVPQRKFLSFKAVVGLSLLWMCLEWSRLLLFCGFSWNPLGLALCHFPSSLQWGSVWGVWGLSFWVMLTNLFLLRVWQRQELRSFWGLISLIIALMPYLFGGVQLAYHQRQLERNESGINVALVQTDWVPSEKHPQLSRIQDFVPFFEQWQHLLRNLNQVTPGSVDLIVLPEAVVPLPAEQSLYLLQDVARELISVWGEEVIGCFPPLQNPYAEVNHKGQVYVSNLFWAQTICNRLQANMVAGFDHTELGRHFNAAFYLSAQHTSVQRYDKQVLLPLAEYLPFVWLRPLTRSYGITEFFTAGSQKALWGQHPVITPCICYEETFTGLVHAARQQGAELLVNVTNDNYYPDSTLHRQHLSHARVRCVENGIPLLRACNAGVSAAMNSLGSVIKQRAAGEGVVRCHLNTYVYKPFFVLYGQWGVFAISLVLMCLAIVLDEHKRTSRILVKTPLN